MRILVVPGRPFASSHIPRDAFAALDFPGAADLADMFEFNRLYVHNRHVDLMKSRELFRRSAPASAG